MALINKIKLDNTVYTISVPIAYSAAATGKVITGLSPKSDGTVTCLISNAPTVTSLTASGQIEAGNFYATSDERLKENIEKVDADKLVETFDHLQVREFNFKKDLSKTPQVGLIAQELEKVVPENLRNCFVHKNKDTGFLSINENKLVYLCIEKIKELEERIKQLEQK